MTNEQVAAPVAETAGEAVQTLYGYWNYLEDPEGLARIRKSLLDANDWHDPAPINCNSLARLLDTIEALRATPPVPAQDDDKLREAGELFNVLRDQSWDLRCFNVPTGGDDYDIGWRVIGHWMAEPRERTMAQVFVDDPAEAVRQALAALKSTAAQEGGAL